MKVSAEASILIQGKCSNCFGKSALSRDMCVALPGISDYSSGS